MNVKTILADFVRAFAVIGDMADRHQIMLKEKPMKIKISLTRDDGTLWDDSYQREIKVSKNLCAKDIDHVPQKLVDITCDILNRIAKKKTQVPPVLTADDIGLLKHFLVKYQEHGGGCEYRDKNPF